ncbi:hypothetical protein D3C76_363230 [compost metagenome]
MQLTTEQVNDAMMDMYPEWRYRWCGGWACACMGAANCSGNASSKGVTREQWEAWVASNPDPDPPKPFDPEELVAVLRQASKEYSEGKTSSQEELKERLRKKYQK